MTDTVVPKTIASTEETVINGDVVTTVTKTKTANPDHSITTTTTVDKTDQTNGNNIVTTLTQTASASSDPDIEKKIIRQIEYYLGDVNMVRDKFLKGEITKDEGWIPLSVLTTFKRLQSLTTDFKTIMNALKNSVSGLLQIDEAGNKIRRHPERSLPNSQAELELTLRNRTVFVKGFPKTDDVTIDKLLVFFEKFGSIESVQMKKQFKSKDFSGAAFVVFSHEDKAREFVEKSKQTEIKYDDGSVLECSLQDDHYKKKALELASGGGKSSADESREKRTNEKHARQDKRKDDLEKKTSEHLEKLNNENLSGALIHLAGMAADTTRELIKEKFNPFTKLPWIDFNKGDAEAWVRLNEANTAKDVLEKVLAAGSGKLVIGTKELTTRVVEGEEEAQFWKEANEKRAASRTQKGDRFSGGKRGGRGGGRDKRGGRRGGRGGGGFGQKRKRNQDDDGGSNDEQEHTTESISLKKTKATSDD